MAKGDGIMCLYIDEEVGCDFEWNEDGTATFYKVYRMYSGAKELGPPIWYNAIVRGPGVVKSNRGGKALTGIEQREDIVYRGIHVFLRESDAARYAISTACEKVVRVRCRKEDLVAFGSSMQRSDPHWPSAVFMKVEITQEEWESVFNYANY